MDETVEFIAFGTNCQVCRKNQQTDLYEVKNIIQRGIAFEKGDKGWRSIRMLNPKTS
jgi:hypothetical protein